MTVTRARKIERSLASTFDVAKVVPPVADGKRFHWKKNHSIVSRRVAGEFY